jgi:hypothetical protein
MAGVYTREKNSLALSAGGDPARPWLVDTLQTPWEIHMSTLTLGLLGLFVLIAAFIAYEWDSEGKAGKGRMTVVESQAPRTVVMRLEFLRPFVATNTAVFSVASEGSVTNVTWAMTGCTGFIHKLFGLFLSMDKLVGGEFAKGLASLKTQVESERAAA